MHGPGKFFNFLFDNRGKLRYFLVVMQKKPLIKFGAMRQASLVGIMIWSAHYHGGQWSQEYRMGCRARTLLKRSNEIGDFLASRWFDALENYVGDSTGSIERPRQYTKEFSEAAKASYQKMERISNKK